MNAQVIGVPKDAVRNRAALDADVLVFDHLEKLRMKGQVEPVADSLGAKEDGVVKLGVFATVALAGVQVEVEISAQLGLRFVHLSQELVTTRVVILFIDHVKAGDEF